MNYFWNQDYKDLITNTQAYYMADKHSKTTFTEMKVDILADPRGNMKKLEEQLNQDYVSRSFTRWVQNRLGN
jgi:hypothetical protein